MVVDMLESRYTVDAAVLYDYLEAKFGKGQFEVIEPEYGVEKWQIQVPRELTYDEKLEIQRRFKETYYQSRR